MPIQIRLPASLLLFCGLLVGCATPSPNSPESVTDSEALAPDVSPTREPVAHSLGDPGFYGDIVLQATEADVVRITLDAEKNENPHETGVYWPIEGSFAEHDLVRVELSGRVVGDMNTENARLMVEMDGDPWTKVWLHPLPLASSVQTLTREGLVDSQTAGKPLQVGLHLGGLKGELQIESINVYHVPTTSDTEKR